MYKDQVLIELDVEAQIVNDRTLILHRAVSEAFDCTVEWDKDSKTVTIKTEVDLVCLSEQTRMQTAYKSFLWSDMEHIIPT